MTKRRDALKAMMTPIAVTEAPDEERRVRPSAASGSVRAMGLSLKSLSDEAGEAQALRLRLEAGEQVVELDPNLVDASFVRDRIEAPSGAEFEAFKQSLAEDGQLAPILVRPHETQAGRYQAAYGHRRLAALRALGRPVKAVVRRLSDEQLIIAQGKENNDRRDLSFIERALFAARLEDRGFSRATLVKALSLQKGNLSTMISLVRSLPEELIIAIGAAQKIGRPRWERLAVALSNSGLAWKRAIAEPDFAEAESDERFERVLKAVSERRSADSRLVHDGAGRAIARLQQSGRTTRLSFDEQMAPQFAAYLVGQLPEIYAAFLRGKDA